MDTIICGCTGTTKETIVNAIKAKGLTTIDQVGEETKAGTVCGSCKIKIKAILTEING